MTYAAILRSEPEGGFTVFVPALRGCLSYGENIPQALRNAEEAIECFLLGLRDTGEQPPAKGDDITSPAQAVTGTLLAHRVTVKEAELQVA